MPIPSAYQPNTHIHTFNICVYSSSSSSSSMVTNEEDQSHIHIEMECVTKIKAENGVRLVKKKNRQKKFNRIWVDTFLEKVRKIRGRLYGGYDLMMNFVIKLWKIILNWNWHNELDNALQDKWFELFRSSEKEMAAKKCSACYRLLRWQQPLSRIFFFFFFLVFLMLFVWINSKEERNLFLFRQNTNFSLHHNLPNRENKKNEFILALLNWFRNKQKTKKNQQIHWIIE